MDFLFGLKTNDFVLLAADQTKVSQIWIIKKDVNKSYQLGSKLMMLCVGEGGDSDQFAEYIEKNLQLYKMRNGYELSPKATARFTRRTIAEALRSQEPYFIHAILGGYDDHDGVYMCKFDYLAAQFESPYLMHGYGGMFCYSILDRIYKKDWTVAEAVEGVKKCFNELKTRFSINLPSFQMWICDKNGIRELETVTA